MTKEMTLEALGTINGGKLPENTDTHTTYNFMDPVIWKNHPEYGTGRVLFPGEFWITVAWWGRVDTVAYPELMRA